MGGGRGSQRIAPLAVWSPWSPLCDQRLRLYYYEEFFCSFNIVLVGLVEAMNVGPCHHGMARPRVADGGTASNMEGSCE